MSGEIKKANWQLLLFGWFKIPVIGFVRPKVTELTNDSLTVRIPLKRRNRNHVGSMYLGVMTVGADLACGLLAYQKVQRMGLKAAPVFKSMTAEYHKRAEADVYFKCSSGNEIDKMIKEANTTGERVTKEIKVSALCKNELVATFTMGLSFKVRS